MNDILVAALVGVATVVLLVKLHALVDLVQYRQLAEVDTASAERLESSGFEAAASASRVRAARYWADAESCRRFLWWPLRHRESKRSEAER